MRVPQRFFLAAILFSLAAMVSGCSGPRSSSSGAPFASDARCAIHSSWCQYNGQYDPGERDYAEQEAQRLNQAEYERLRKAASQ